MPRGTVSGNGIVTDGLVLALDASNIKSYVSGSNIWRDLTVNVNNGTLTNGPTFNSTDGGNIVFDGIDDSVKLLNISHSYLSSSTVEVIFKVNSYNGSGNYAVAGYDFSGGNYSNSTTGMIYVRQDTNKIKSAVITTSQIYREVTSTTNISLQKYYSATLTKDTINGILKLYVNGILENQNTFDAATYAQWSTIGTYIGNNNFILGNYSSNNWGGGPSFNGSILNVKLYNRILSDIEILQNYNAIKTRFGI